MSISVTTLIQQQQEIIQAHLGDTVSLVLDNHNEANIATKLVTQIFWCPSAYKSYVDTIQ